MQESKTERGPRFHYQSTVFLDFAELLQARNWLNGQRGWPSNLTGSAGETDEQMQVHGVLRQSYPLDMEAEVQLDGTLKPVAVTVGGQRYLLIPADHFPPPVV